ncbi:hypothetical protein [Salipiger mucosus]|uniref:Uncharacterized protein n=1 Tax=Salipiger mucosus DSM 16094 TaxID=1123237 RepID=S9QKX2_9RHOB|nr:hypothetical protein [Salipiger mucosus]EPX80442.1 hypothetical protein Salmuc_03758 [Salipiger mucosus DSM 16094]
MSRGLRLFAPVALLAAVAAVLALRAGREAAELSETDVIEAMVARYLDEGGDDAQRSDCTGRPGTAPAWVVVTCAGEAETLRYAVDRAGRLLSRDVTRRPEA